MPTKNSKDETANNGQPPAYSDKFPPHDDVALPDLSARLAQLDLSSIDEGTPHQPVIAVSPDHCIAHLKLLEAFFQLREEIGNTDNLFGIPSPDFGEALATSEISENDQALAQIKVREKRWAVYVARATERFHKWWDTCVPTTLEGAPHHKLTTDELCSKGVHDIPVKGKPIKQLGSKDHLPPLDVIMVWHAYMLNPRCFLEDCFRYGKIDFYATPFPWPAVNQCIDNTTFDFNLTEQAISNFESATQLSCNNLDDPEEHSLICGNCGQSCSFPWTSGSIWSMEWKEMQPGEGFADPNFNLRCQHCRRPISHNYLRGQKFHNDVQLLLKQNLPLPGTVLNRNGQPDAVSNWLSYPNQFFPNLLIKEGLSKKMLDATRPSYHLGQMDDVKSVFEQGLTDPALMMRIKKIRNSSLPKDRVSIRKCMSRYWYNSSPFALDLVGAVIRQGSFVEKMHNIDWLHSPALRSTMERLITKYGRFFDIIKNNPRHIAVPTLDVDLAWHTHQLNPQAYYIYSDRQTKTLVDHDDKIEETKLSDQFIWTSKVYQEKYGEPYSSCTCWYCEAVRESHTRNFDKLFKRKKYAANDMVHNADVTSDPLKSPHISAHNAVKTVETVALSLVKRAELDKAYQKACARARKRGYKEPVRDDYFYATAWGYPMAYPIFFPYAVPAGIGNGSGGGTPGDPCYVETSPGNYGNCASGTCGGMAAAGGAGCASTGGNCGSSVGCGSGCGGGGGGSSGGCGGGGWSACGGGGGGGGGGGCGGGGGG